MDGNNICSALAGPCDRFILSQLSVQNVAVINFGKNLNLKMPEGLGHQ